MVSSARLRYAADSDPGRMRSNNEDRVWCDPERGIFLVVDGVGGQAAGEKAAEVAVSLIRGRLERQTGSPGQRIREAITLANNEILRLARGNPEWAGMACVLTVALVDSDTAWIGHVGDSRLYKIRGGQIQKVTHDHSPVGEREDQQDLSEADAMRHPRRNEVYRDVGSELHTPDDRDFIESLEIPFEPDSVLLLCSDGLSDQVTSAEILKIVTQGAGSEEEKVRGLIAAANRAGGKDNVSVVLVEGPGFRRQAVAPPVRRGHWLTSGPMLVLYGLLAGLLAAAALEWRFGWLDHVRPAPQPAAIAPRVLVVGNAEGAQFGAIQDALAQARAGDTIELLAGEYTTSVVMREGVGIRARVPLVAVLRGTVTADGLHSGSLSGLRILGEEKTPAAAAVRLSGSSVELTDCEISGAGTGIEISGGRPVVRANTIQDSLQSALTISGEATPWISHNVIARNGRKTRRPAVAVADPARPVLFGNTFSDNATPAVAIPSGMEQGPLLKFNTFLRGQTVGQAVRRTAGATE
jgi:serine/threonine protein phosphatase PrpC